MSDPETGEEDLSPAERRLLEHLELVRLDKPAPDSSLSERIMRKARWQRTLRGPLEVVGIIASALSGAIGLLIRGGSSR